MAKQEAGPARPSKRRLKAPAETVRQRQTSVASKAEKPNHRIRSAVGRGISWPFRKVAGWKFWQHKAMKPVRFVAKWIGLIVWPPYLRRSLRELRLVTWPNWRQTWRLTFAVLGFSVVFGAFIYVIDFGLDKLFKEVLLR